MTSVESPMPVLFVTTNGRGLGHVTRMLAMARRASQHVQPIFFTLSEAAHLVSNEGYPVEYLPSQQRLDAFSREAWHALLHTRLSAAVRRYGPRAVVFDGPVPYAGLLGVQGDNPRLPFVWVRRPMWQPNLPGPSSDIARRFRLIIEPRDASGLLDQGPTRRLLGFVRQVPPVTVLDPDDALPSEDARQGLGLDPNRPAVLVNLSDDDSDERAHKTRKIADKIAAAGDYQVFVPRHVLHVGPAAHDDVTCAPVYPLAKYLRAFDFAVSSPGYNAYHECLAAGVPSIWMPKTTSTHDDQQARADFAWSSGFGLAVAPGSEGDLDRALRQIMSTRQRGRMRAAARALAQPNGAGQAMRLIEDAAADELPRQRTGYTHGSTARLMDGPRLAALDPSTRRLPGNACVVVGIGLDDEAAEQVTRQLAQESRNDSSFVPILLMEATKAGYARAQDLLHETVVPIDHWPLVAGEESYESYLSDRVEQMRASYGASRVIEAKEGADISGSAALRADDH